MALRTGFDRGTGPVVVSAGQAAVLRTAVVLEEVVDHLRARSQHASS